MYPYLVPFAYLFPEQGPAETRVITTHGYPSLPDDEYALLESYCVDPTCDCRRVMLNVLPRRRMAQGYLATISFGFDRQAELAGPFLDPLNPQSKHAQVLLDLVTRRVLEADPPTSPVWKRTIVRSSRPWLTPHTRCNGFWLNWRPRTSSSHAARRAPDGDRAGHLP